MGKKVVYSGLTKDRGTSPMTDSYSTLEILSTYAPYGYTEAKEELLEMFVRLLITQEGDHERIASILEAIEDTAHDALIYYRAEQPNEQ